MREVEGDSAISPIHDKVDYTFNNLLRPRQYLQTPNEKNRDTNEDIKTFSYTDEKKLWKNIIYDDYLYEKAPIILENFKLLEWIPQSPGLFHTNDAIEMRDLIKQSPDKILYKHNNSVVYNPDGKAELIKAGMGCIRVDLKPIGGRYLKFYGATSSDDAHSGIIVAVPENSEQLYHKVSSLMKVQKGIVCDIEGEIAVLPKNLSDIYIGREIPKMYVIAKNVNHNDNLKKGMADVTAAVAFSGKVNNIQGIYCTLSHFDPLLQESLTKCVKWMEDEYVKERYSGQVLTDFDEHKRHFNGNVLFPLNYLMTPTPDQSQIDKLRTLLRDHLNLAEDKIQYIFKKEYVSSITVSHDSHDTINVGNVSGNGIVIGKNIKVGSININSLNKELQKVPNEYANSLKTLSDNLNKEFQKYQVPEEKTSQIQKSIVALGKEVEDITPGKEEEINYVKKTKIEAQTVDLVDKVLDALPKVAETVSTFIPILSPFSKLIGKGVEHIVNAVKESKSGK